MHTRDSAYSPRGSGFHLSEAAAVEVSLQELEMMTGEEALLKEPP